MSDTLVLDMSTQSEGAAAVFTKRDWLSILDNQNQNYNGNQSVVDTSQLANSNKYMNYREGYFTVPLLLTVTGTPADPAVAWTPATAATSCDFNFGLKNWYGSIIHSFTLDYNGTTIIQQTPYIGLWNTFKLMTSLSVDDLRTQGSLIGFYPDEATCWTYRTGGAAGGLGVCNNLIRSATTAALYTGAFTNSSQLNQVNPANNGVNTGLLQRIMSWNVDPDGLAGSTTGDTLAIGGGNNVNGVLPSDAFLTLWQSFIFNKVNTAIAPDTLKAGAWQASICGIVYLKHIHSFFERVPLLKGVFMKMTLNLNQSSVSWTSTDAGNGFDSNTVNVNSPLGGVSPLMLSDPFTNGVATSMPVGSYIYSIAVGNKVLNTSQSTSLTAAIQAPNIGSIILNVPAYTFNPVFEQSYLSSPVKKIVYTDVYQYQVLGVGGNQTFNNLITNGIANIKSVLLLPFYGAGNYNNAPATLGTPQGGVAVGNQGLVPFQSPFDPAGGGPTSPMVHFTQFNIQISGQNAIYNTERFSYEQFANQFKGVNAINGGQTDGLTSGLVGLKDWTYEYCYYYVNCGRMLPVEEAVPKSVNILGQNKNSSAIDIYVFVEYGVEVSVDVLTGSRV
jgi:hypothetical protein